MADIWFHRADGTKLLALCVCGKGFAHRRQLHRVSQFGAGAMRLDITDALGGDARVTQGAQDHVGLPIHAGAV